MRALLLLALPRHPLVVPHTVLVARGRCWHSVGNPNCRLPQGSPTEHSNSLVSSPLTSLTSSSPELGSATTTTTTTRMASSSTTAESEGNNEHAIAVPALTVDPFCYRQFSSHENSKSYGGTIFQGISIEEFAKVVNERYHEYNLVEGYAPFCKHLFIKNDFTDATVNVLKITEENEHLLRTRYEARNDKELPVLSRFFERSSFPKTFTLPKAKYLDLILYSREQIEKENEAMMGKKEKEKEEDGSSSSSSDSKSPWGIVSIKAQDVDFELPMQPITAMRNALGKSEGGSGIPMNREKYMEAYNYWKDHAVVQ